MERAGSSMRDVVQRFAALQRSERTGELYGSITELFLAFLGDGREPQQRDVEDFLNRRLALGRRAAPSTFNLELAALRKFGAFATKERVWTYNPTLEIARKLVPDADPTFLLQAEVWEFFRAVPCVSPPSQHVRDRALLAIFFLMGPRVNEVEQLNVIQTDLRNALLLRVHRKGGRVQNLPLGPEVLCLVREWLEKERPKMANPGEPALFVSRLGTRLSSRSMERFFERLWRHLQLPRRVTPHSARHSFITNALLMGAELTAVSNAAGHRSVRTTMHYRHLASFEGRRVAGIVGALVPSELIPDERRQPVQPLRAAAVPPEWEPLVQQPGAANDTKNDLDGQLRLSGEG